MTRSSEASVPTGHGPLELTSLPPLALGQALCLHAPSVSKSVKELIRGDKGGEKVRGVYGQEGEAAEKGGEGPCWDAGRLL